MIQNKSIVITGASSGIGKAILELLAAPEHHNRIVAASRSIGKLSGFGENVTLFPCDLSGQEGVDALFTNGRVDRDKLPEGLYCYDLRVSDDDPGELRYLEERVVVNHAGSVITAQPIELPESGRLDVYDDMGFRGGSMTLRQFFEDAYPEKAKKSRNTEEVEAESVSFAVCAYYGIATGENSFGYIASWSKDKELKELKASLETINKASSELITDIDRNYAAIMKERGIEQTAEKDGKVTAICVKVGESVMEDDALIVIE